MRTLTKALTLVLLPLAVMGCKKDTPPANATEANVSENAADLDSAGPMNDGTAAADGNAMDHAAGVTDHGVTGVTDHSVTGVTDHSATSAPGH